MMRVSDALTRFAPPGVEIVKRARDARLDVLHVIGSDAIEAARQARSRGQQYAMIQYCLRTTQLPSTDAWIDTWRRSAAVWSYYDLIRECAEDRTTLPLGLEQQLYLAPLGADGETFDARVRPAVPRYVILTSGYVAETECVTECWAAASAVGRRVFHLGPQRQFTSIDSRHVTFGHGIKDDELAEAYRNSEYVAGMRRVEGFELPAAEGLLCGARPVMLDRHHYRDWFGGWAEYVDEAPSNELTAQLTRLFSEPTRRVSDDEREAAARRFDWRTIASGFWDRILPQL